MKLSESNVVIISYLSEIPIYFLDHIESAGDVELVELAHMKKDGTYAVGFKIIKNPPECKTAAEVTRYINSLADVDKEELIRQLHLQ